MKRLYALMMMLVMAMSSFAYDTSLLCFTAEESGISVSFEIRGTVTTNPVLKYSTDGSTWTNYTLGAKIKLSDIGSKVYFKAKDYNTTFSKDCDNYVYFTSTGKVAASGNIMNLLDPSTNLSMTNVPDKAFYYLFRNCTGLTTAPNLPATTLGRYCYADMFYGCTGLTAAPKLPAKNMNNNCYERMFEGCTGLKETPALPATNLVSNCYAYMFLGCTGLETAPEELPATKLWDGCYSGMFYRCTSLKNAPALPATTLVNGCYEAMFSGCTNLKEAPALPAKTLATSCYEDMFSGCTSITEAPALPVTTLATSCYEEMFGNCTGLTAAPVLPATTMAESCYKYMFEYCTSLVTAPELPSTSLSDGCYEDMFYGCTSLKKAPKLPATAIPEFAYDNMFRDCTSLTEAPELPATTLSMYCYRLMFSGCTSLKKIIVGFTAWDAADNCTYWWLKDVASTGTFYGPAGLDLTRTGESYIPEGWKAKDVNSLPPTIPDMADLIDVLKGNKTATDDYDIDGNGNVDVNDAKVLSYKILEKEDESHESVDLGLSVLWSTCNIGAEKPSDSGLYFAWGDTESATSDVSDGRAFDWTDYKWCEGTEKSLTKYNADSSYGTVDNKTILDSSDDAAITSWGGMWRMPTYAELTDLKDGCYWEWTDDYNSAGVPGYIVYKAKATADRGVQKCKDKEATTEATYSLEDTHIFLPATGYRSYSSFRRKGTEFCLYASSLYRNSQADMLICMSDIVYSGNGYRYPGYPIRPVKVRAEEGVQAMAILKLKDSYSTIDVGQYQGVSVSCNSDGAITYKSSDPSVATIDATTGMMYGLKAGTTVITVSVAATSKYEATSLSFTLTVEEDDPHTYVDLGLSVKWATCNLGADTPVEYGLYYAWGETTGYTSSEGHNFNFSNYKWIASGGSIWTDVTKYTYADGRTNAVYYSNKTYVGSTINGVTYLNKTVLDPEDDAATANLGSDWRMPTEAELTELEEKCTWTWTTQNGVNGYLVTSNVAGYTNKSIFLPACGYIKSTTYSGNGTEGYYWTNSLATNSGFSARGSYLYFKSGSVKTDNQDRCYGRSIRPVQP